jgi:DNA-binding CsgD family transcriptional regulator
MTLRVLAAADSSRGSFEPRPHRAALDPAAAAARLRREAAEGRLDRSAVDAVLAEAGHRHEGRSSGPAGLTAREVEVLSLVARGCSTSEVARRLVISGKTVSNHLEHIYLKAGVTNRAGAAMFAVEHGLVGGRDDEATTP